MNPAVHGLVYTAISITAHTSGTSNVPSETDFNKSISEGLRSRASRRYPATLLDARYLPNVPFNACDRTGAVVLEASPRQSFRCYALSVPVRRKWFFLGQSKRCGRPPMGQPPGYGVCASVSIEVGCVVSEQQPSQSLPSLQAT